MFDHITNPKTLKLDILKLYDNQELAQKCDDLKMKFVFSHHFVNPLNVSEFKKEILSKIKSIPSLTAIDTLMSIRNSIKTERQQYMLGIKAMLKNPFEYYKRILNDCIFLARYAKFKQRLKFADELLEKMLNAERGKP